MLDQPIEFIYGAFIGYLAFCNQSVTDYGSRTLCRELKLIGTNSYHLQYSELGTQGIAFADLLSCEEIEILFGDEFLDKYTER